MIKADFINIEGKLVGPVIVEGSALQLLFELNSIIKEFIESNKSRELLHAVLQNNLDAINKQMAEDELDRERFDACVAVLERNSK